MRAGWLLMLPLSLVAGTAVPQTSRQRQAAQFDRAEAELVAARVEARRLQAIADRATGELERLRAQQRVVIGEIEAAEAGITLAGLRLAVAEARARAQRRALVEVQRPVSALITGVVMMGERGPLLALVDEGSVDGLVETRILLDSTLPVIRSRSRGYAARLASAERALRQQQAAQAELKASYATLEQGRRRFRGLEQRLIERSMRTGTAAIAASDRLLALSEASDEARDHQRGVSTAAVLAAANPIPARPQSADGPLFRAPFAYRLPVNAPVTRGLGDVDRSGVRARGITLATTRGALLDAPGAGVVGFAGPFRGFDGVLIIDHGAGWKTMIVNASAQVRRGQRVAPGEPVGRALGPISVELYRNGKPYSAALIAGSSPALSKGGEGG